MALIFSKRLSTTDAKMRLSIPAKSLAHLPDFKGQHAVDFDVRDEDGRVWTFRCHVRRKAAYRKPVLTKGWRAFACLKQLQAGDKVELYMDSAEASSHGRYYVRIQKAVLNPTPDGSASVSPKEK